MKPVVLAFLLDLVLGDPRWLPHPVVAMGASITRLERILRRVARSPLGERLAGGLMVALVVGGFYLATLAVLRLAAGISPDRLTPVLSVLLLYTTLATRGLHDHVLAVYGALRQGDLPAARQAVSLLVGRDTAHLDEDEVCRAAVESAAENACDGIVAPLFYAFLGGAPLAMAYKAVNTLDSMVGYRDERYRHFGWAAARLDDLANFLPARLSALLLLGAGLLLGHPARRALDVVRRDARRHPSPNSGYPEAAVAGLLGVRLGGLNYYRGVPSFRAYLGDPVCRLVPAHLQTTMTLVEVSAGLGLVCLAGLDQVCEVIAPQLAALVLAAPGGGR